MSEFVPNSLMAVCGIFLLPVLLWFVQQRQTRNTWTYGIVFLIVFSRGTLELLGVSSTLIRIVIEVFILVLFYQHVLAINKLKKAVLPSIGWLVFFLIVSAISVSLNSTNTGLFLLYLRDYLAMPLFFYSATNTFFNQREKSLLITLLKYLFIAQIGAGLLKWGIVGVMEPYIGTMNVLGGSLTVLISLIGVAYCLADYLFSRNRKQILWIAGFLLFAIIGTKRAVVFYVPILFLLLTLVHQLRFVSRQSKLTHRIILISGLSVILVYFSLRLIPTLNPEQKVWGSFNLNYALDYSERYMTTGAGSEVEIGRSEAPLYVINLLYNDNFFNMLLGYGAGHLVKSSLNQNIAKAGSHQDLSEKLYGVGYAARTGFIQLLLQVGILGLGLYTAWLFSLYRTYRHKFISLLQRDYAKKSYLLFIGLWFVLIIDFFTYSITSVQISSMAFVFFWFLATFSNLRKDTSIRKHENTY